MNSPLTNVVIYADHNNFSDGRSGHSLKKITVHHTGGVMSAESIGYLWQNPNRECSSHYGIGMDGRIGQYVDEYDTAWTDSNWESNCTSVTIETSNCDVGGDWPVSDASLESLIKLCADISIRNGLGLLVPGQNLTWHSMYAATTCPGDYLRARMQYIADRANEIISGGQPTPAPTGNRVEELQRFLNNNYGYNVDVDGIYGPDTKKHSIMALQTEFNIQLGSGLEVDGLFGPATYNACPNLYVGMSGNITRLCQYMLEIKGCSVGSYGVDGIFGDGTYNAVIQYQSTHGLDQVDGIIGKDTFDSLFD